MSNASFAAANAGRRGGEMLDRGVAFANRHRDAWPAVAIIVVTAIAYQFTLASLFDFLRLDTPLAYLPLLPLFCIGIAYVTVKRYERARQPLRDRQVDYLVGVPMLVVALLLITLAPVIASTYYWSDRADVVSMALFAGGATIIAYGITWFWRLKACFIFLLLMWPALYLHLMAGVMQSFSDWTNTALAQVVHLLPLGVSLGGQPGLLIVPQHSAAPLTISVGSACSGADSVLGFALIGAAILTVMGGGKGRKLLWWISGMVLCFIFNILRLTSILWLASAGQATFALNGYHAVIGLILFAIAVVVMMWALPHFGLHSKPPVVDTSRRSRAAGLDTTVLTVQLHEGGEQSSAPSQSAHAAPSPAPQPPPRWTRRRIAGMSAAALLAALVALADHGLQPYAAFDDGSGAPTVKPFATLASAPKGWTVYEIAEYPWATEYYGDNASWIRYEVTSPNGGLAFADVVLTDDKGSLDTYNLENCFLFHNYDIRTSERIDLGGGVYGLLLNYHDPSEDQNWASVSWAWPVNENGTTYYERIDLQSNPLGGTPNASGAAPVAQPGGIQDILLDLLNGVSGGHDDPSAKPVYAKVDGSLQSIAGALVNRALQNGS